jgi:hypothetical protein
MRLRRRTLVELLQADIDKAASRRPAPYLVLERYLVPLEHRHMN